MGGKRKKNCSGCGNKHKSPWGPLQCPYLQGKGGGSGESVESGDTTGGRLGDGSGGAGVGTPPPRDSAAYIRELEDRIAHLMDYNKLCEEEATIAALESQLRDLQIATLGRKVGTAPGGGSAAPGVGVPVFNPSQLIGVHTGMAADPPLGRQQPTAGSWDVPRHHSSPSEFYLDTSKPVDKLSYWEFLYADALVQEDRPDAGYINHLRFIAWKAAMGGAYQTQALIRYDQHVTSKVLKGLINDWPFGDDEACCLHLGSDGILSFRQLSFRSPRPQGIHQDYSDFPQDIYAGCITSDTVTRLHASVACVL